MDAGFHEFYSGCFQVRSVLRDNWNIYRHFPRCALDIIEVRLKNNYLRMGMVKVALVFPLLRLNRLELSLPPNYNFLTPRHCPKLCPKVDLLPQLYNTNRLFQLSEWQITWVESSWIGYINWIYSWELCATNPGNYFKMHQELRFYHRICQSLVVIKDNMI